MHGEVLVDDARARTPAPTLVLQAEDGAEILRWTLRSAKVRFLRMTAGFMGGTPHLNYFTSRSKWSSIWWKR
jgi:hypothetical protein